MSSLVNDIIGGLWSATKGMASDVKTLATSGPGGRIVLGGVGGGVYAGATSEFENTNLASQRITQGAVAGGLLGFGINSATGQAMVSLGRAGWTAARNLPSVARTVGPAAKKSLPYLAGGAVGGAVLDNIANNAFQVSGPNIQYNQAQIAANPTDFGFVSPMGAITGGATGRNYLLQNSTNGLVQAMHNNRHR